jgi:hypothetical protein
MSMAYSIELLKHVLPNLHTWDTFWSDENNDESKHDEADYIHRELAEIAVNAKKASCASNSSRHSERVKQWEPPWGMPWDQYLELSWAQLELQRWERPSDCQWEPPWGMPWDQHLEQP